MAFGASASTSGARLTHPTSTCIHSTCFSTSASFPLAPPPVLPSLPFRRHTLGRAIGRLSFSGFARLVDHQFDLHLRQRVPERRRSGRGRTNRLYDCEGKKNSNGWFEARGKGKWNTVCIANCVHISEEDAYRTGLVYLGKTSLRVSRMGVGTLQWGDPSCGFGSRYDEGDLLQAYEKLTHGGINFFDTAEVYGYQNLKNGSSSEQILGRFVKNARRVGVEVGGEEAEEEGSGGVPVVIATKFFTIPWTNLLVGGGVRLGRQSMIAALKESVKRIGIERVDLYQIHFPFPTFSNTALMEGLKEAFELGLTTAVGVSNYSISQMVDAYEILGRANIPLASNQVRYNLLSRQAESDGMLQTCKDLSISLIAYSPLASGALSDSALLRNDSKALKVKPLLEEMKAIGEAHGGKSIAQVALNYLVAKGAIPIPACKSVEQAEQHLQVLGWELSSHETSILEDRADNLRLN